VSGLLGCPMCGRAAEFVSPSDLACYVMCESCGICTSEHRTEAEAIAAWNRRTPPAGAGEAFVRGDFAGISTDEGFAADNLAIALCSYFSDSLIRPVNDEETENGWGAWVEAQTDKVLDAITAKANSRIAAPTPLPEAVRELPGKWRAEADCCPRRDDDEASIALMQCADELSAALRAIPAQAQRKENDDG
jgi:Lar family restriction alleviation protein